MAEMTFKPIKPSVRAALSVEPLAISILDIGAMAEGEDRYANLLRQELATVVGFEPNLAQLDLLLKQATPRKRYVPYFLGVGGPATFHITRYPGCCSLYEPDPSIIDMFTYMGASLTTENFHVAKTIPVETTRLDDVPGLPAPDYIKLDIQGAELDVLRHGTRTLRSVLVLEVEVEFLPMYKGQPLFGDIQTFLRGEGFMLHKLIDVAGRMFRPLQFGENPREPMSQLLYADAVFVRDFSAFGGWTDEQLLKGAAILYEPYCSHDLAHRLLAEYDRRRGTRTAAALTAALISMGSIPTLYLNQKLDA